MSEVTADSIKAIDRAASRGRIDEASREAKILEKAYGEQLQIALAESGLSAPDVLLIGPPRTGTTWLKAVLGDHPDILMATGEPNVLWHAGDGGLFEALRWYARSDVWRGPRKSSGIIADKSPGYIGLSDAAICVLTALLPNLKIVIGQRNETERLWSAIFHRMHDVGFHGTWDQFCIKFKNDVLHELDYGKVHVHINRWRNSLDTKNIFIYEFSEITHDPEHLVSKLLNHISARSICNINSTERSAIIERIRVNPNPSNIGAPPAGFIEAVTTLVS